MALYFPNAKGFEIENAHITNAGRDYRHHSAYNIESGNVGRYQDVRDGGDSKVERNDLVPDEVLARGDIIGEGDGHRLAVHCGMIRQEWKADNEGNALMSCWYHVDPSGFIPSSSTLNHWASVELYLSHVPSHLAM